MEWDGKIERRSMGSDDRDILIEVRNDVKHIVTTVSKHIEDDKTQFDRLNKGQEYLMKIVWCGVGIAAFIAFVFKFFK